ncbi:acetyltransferase [Litorivicinus sp.]|nr:acetyltransferase [Litorivicinus sp.]MDC1239977.1 acetyltransferase [Litorivicinus sp.]
MLADNLSRKSIIVVGAGRHARVLVDALVLRDARIIGLIDPCKDKGSECWGFTILGDDNILRGYNGVDVGLVNGLGSALTSPGNPSRRVVASRLEAKGFHFLTVIHPSAIICSDCTFGVGSQVMAGAVIQAGVNIGDSCIINTGVIIDHGCEISAGCHLAPGVTLSGGVVVGENTHIGTGAVVIHDVKIGANCIIGAGSIIHQDVPDNAKFVQPRVSISTMIEL